MAVSLQQTCQEHAPANDRDQEVAGLGHKLEWAIEVEQSKDVLQDDILC